MTHADWTYQNATIIQHCAVMGRLEKRVRAYRVDPVSFSVAFIEPRKRRVFGFSIQPDNLRYLTIEAEGQVVYDSRVDVPCDMTKWDATNREWRDRRPFSSVAAAARRPEA